MKRIVFLLGVVAWMSPSVGSAVIAGSLHDLTVAPYNAASICIPCHIPHRPLQNVPLWNHALSVVAGYQLYNSNATYSGSNTAAYLAVSGANYSFAGTTSKACFSCHDGTVAVASGVSILPASANWIFWNGGAATVAGSNLGMLGSHPIGINYQTVQTAHPTDYNTVASLSPVTVDASNIVQCGSCHDPHNPLGAASKMLRMANNTSQLCLKCHIK